MKFLFTLNLVLLYSFSLHAEISSKDIDTNDDQKPDRIEKFSDGRLISVTRSTKYNDKFDEVSYYFPYESPRKPTEVIEKDVDGDGKAERIEKIYRNPVTDLMIKTIKVTLKRSPAAVEKSWSIHSKLSQLQKKDQVQCGGELNLDQLDIMKLVDDVSAVRFSLDKGYYKTGWGYDIHQSCMDKWGADTFPNLIKTSMQTGLKCLEDLAANSKGINGAYKNAKDFKQLLSSKTVAITCDEKEYNWNGTRAHASTDSNDVLKGSDVKHPFVSINPSFPDVSAKPTVKEKDKISATIFHEQFHNIGLMHGLDIEYAYSCSTCCLGKNDDKKTKDLACKICTGSYQGTADKAYILDMIELGNDSANISYNAQLAATNYQKEFPEDRFGVLAYANASSEYSGSIGNELGKILKANLKDVSILENFLLDRSLKFSESENKFIEPYSKLLAESYYSLYLEKNKGKVLDNYEKQLPKLNELLKAQKNASENEKYYYDDMVEKLKDQLLDISLNNYPERDAHSIRASKLLDTLNL